MLAHDAFISAKPGVLVDFHGFSAILLDNFKMSVIIHIWVCYEYSRKASIAVVFVLIDFI